MLKKFRAFGLAGEGYVASDIEEDELLNGKGDAHDQGGIPKEFFCSTRKTVYRRRKTNKAPRKRTFIMNMTKYPDILMKTANNIGIGGGGGGGKTSSSHRKSLKRSGSALNITSRWNATGPADHTNIEGVKPFSPSSTSALVSHHSAESLSVLYPMEATSSPTSQLYVSDFLFLPSVPEFGLSTPTPSHEDLALTLSNGNTNGLALLVDNKSDAVFDDSDTESVDTTIYSNNHLTNVNHDEDVLNSRNNGSSLLYMVSLSIDASKPSEYAAVLLDLQGETLDLEEWSSSNNSSHSRCHGSVNRADNDAYGSIDIDVDNNDDEEEEESDDHLPYSLRTTAVQPFLMPYVMEAEFGAYCFVPGSPSPSRSSAALADAPPSKRPALKRVLADGENAS
eukprot:CAMPEP_0175076384 /NCGR_PEP_ID=MMETSP0052_2-20121109/22692_1 /TAXON_ID=51329 ORGANISM="Polytomella parva, Strain SAG 63-3" /NCGR_SAMPLE_ID=MMETSP0052_2 /ASSEMBLY_ACC=CAM_ASM_000194 /LENGTH=393 /DNA_ID=CAMNT_0016345507 /DNA_START=42 /DNA_END=1219 /DNA_ORIENTATION=-